MADAIDLTGLDDKQLEALQAAINRRSRSKIDWDNMSDQERAMFNKTIEPRTHKTMHYEYPKSLYGKFADGTIKAATVQNEGEERMLRANHPEADWKDLLRDHGVETCPSPPDRAKAAGFVTVAVTPPVSIPDPVPAQMMVEEHPAAVAARRGRPPGSKNKEQEAA